MGLDIQDGTGLDCQPAVKIKVFGIGGAGNNGVNRMIQERIREVDCLAINTDVQVLRKLQADQKIVLGSELTHGQGAGGRPEMGQLAAEESKKELIGLIEDADMIFIMAGMGGGTGTGAAPFIAKLAREMKKLVVGVVTLPFEFEGREKMKRAQEGLAGLRKYADSMITIENDRIVDIAEEDMSFDDAFKRVDEVLLTAVRSVSDLILSTGTMNIDFADVQAVMENQGNALLGMGRAEGGDRVVHAMRGALEHPLLNHHSIQKAKGILVNLRGANIRIKEFTNAMHLIQDIASEDAILKCGVVPCEEAGEELFVTIIATGFENPAKGRESLLRSQEIEEKEQVKRFMKVREEMEKKKEVSTREVATSLDTPQEQTLGELASFD